VSDTPFRVPPKVTELNRHFWTGGADGALHMQRCRDDGTWIHPPSPVCPTCLARNIEIATLAGTGVVHAVTVNHQAWNPTMPTPYVIALIELDEGPRLLSNVTDAEPKDVTVGLPVEVWFEPVPAGRHTVHLPLFRPSREPAAPPRVLRGLADGGDQLTIGEGVADPPKRVLQRPTREGPQHTQRVGERAAIFAGVGMSQVGRGLGRDPMDLTVEACLRAIEDAGLTRDDIDGISTYPGELGGPASFAGPGTPAVQDALRLAVNWHGGGPEGPAQMGAIINAIMAVSTGLARNVLVYRTVTEATGKQGGEGGGATAAASPKGVGGWLSWLLPYAAYSAANWAALYASRHMHEYGTTREQLGALAVNARANAAKNPNAIYTDAMSLDDYLDVRMISTPLCLYDCDAPTDGSTAFVISHRDTAGDLPNPAVHVNAVGTGLYGRPSWDQWEDLTTMAARDAATSLWARTDLAPADVDVAQLYDGFSIINLVWLEALGFCERGEGGPFIEGGGRIALDGELPLNTGGGQLSGGRLHGFGLVHEAVLQLRGQADGRQVTDPEVAIVANGGGNLAGAMLLTRGTG